MSTKFLKGIRALWKMVRRRRQAAEVDEANNEVVAEIDELGLEAWELDVYNSITNEERQRDFIRMVRARGTLEVVTPEVARNARSSIVSSLTSTVELTTTEKNRLISEGVGKLFRK
jgi:hypothetical protein